MINLLIKWLSLKPRIYVNLVTVAITTISILGVSYYSLKTAKNELSQHANYTSELVEDTVVSENVYQLHIAALNFTYNGILSAADKVDFYYEVIRQHLFSSPSQLENADKIINSLDNYYRGFNQLRSLLEKRRLSTNEILPRIELDIENQLKTIIVKNNSNKQSALALSESLVLFQQSVSHSNVYFRRFDVESLTQAREALRLVSQRLSAVLTQTTDPTTQKELSSIQLLISEFNNSFGATVEQTRGFLYLVNVILAAEANEILFQTRARNINSRKSLEANKKSIELQLDQLIKNLILFSSIALILQFIFSYWIAMSIASPISTITKVFNQLSEGSGKSQIPSYPQTDEIGDLINAARTFRQINIENRKIIHDYKELREQLEQRIAQRTQELNAMNKEFSIAKENAEQVAKTRSDFIANVSHEIRTPINAVLGMTYLLQSTTLDTQQEEYLENISSSSKKLLSIINDILDFSKMEAGKLRIESTELDLFQVVDDSIKMLQAIAYSKGIQIHSHFDNQITRFYLGDPLRLGQVITNLLNNAIKFTEKGHVGIHIEAVNIQRLRIKIFDTGMGMSKEEQDRLFQAFSQADTSTTRRFGGTGLGLVISKQIIESMGGTISLESEKDIGTTFSIEIDMKRIPSKKNENPLKDKVALLIEKDDISRNAFNHTLQHLGLEVFSYERFIKLKHSEIDIILYAIEKRLDNPLEDNTFAQLKATYPKTPLAIIYPMSMTSQLNDNTEAMYIQKPCQPIQIEKVLLKILNNPHIDSSIDQGSVSSQPIHDKNNEATSKIQAIDKSLGLIYSGSDTALYNQLLKSFYLKYRSGEQRLNEAFTADSPANFHLEIHSLKGVAANIGASSLADACNELYKDPSRKNLETVVTKLNLVIAELATSDAILVEESPSEGLFDQEEFYAQMEHLTQAVKRRRPKEIKPVIDYIKTINLPSTLSGLVNQLLIQIQQFDYTEALETIENIFHAK